MFKRPFAFTLILLSQSLIAKTLIIGDSHLTAHSIFTKAFKKEVLSSVYYKDEEILWLAACGSRLKHFIPSSKGKLLRTKCGLTYIHKSSTGEVKAFRKKRSTVPQGPEHIKSLLSGKKMTAPGKSLLEGKDHIILFLGSNYLLKIRSKWRASRKRIQRDLNWFLESLGDDQKCTWITPPSMRRFGNTLVTQIETSIEQHLAGRCTLYKLSAYTNYPPRGGDGIHYPSSKRLKRKYESWNNQALEIQDFFKKITAEMGQSQYKPQPQPH